MCIKLMKSSQSKKHRLEIYSLFINKHSVLDQDEVQQHVLSANCVDQPIMETEIVQGFVQIFS